MGKKVFLTLTICLLFAAGSQADIVHTVQSGNWNDAATWNDSNSVNRVPIVGDDAYIQPGDTVTADTAGVADRLYVGINWGYGMGTLNVGTGADLSLDDGAGATSLSIGFYGTDGTVNMTDGSITANGWVIIGDSNDANQASNGYLNISGGTFQVAENLVLGFNGGATGTVVQSGGFVSATLLVMGNYATDTGSGSYTISGNSNLTLAGASIGLYNTSEFRVIGADPNIHVTSDNFLVNQYDAGLPALSYESKLAFDIAAIGIAPIIVDTGYATITHGTVFEFSGGVAGQSYVIVDVLNPSQQVWFYPGTYTINNPSKYSLSLSPDGQQLIVTVAPCTAEVQGDLNGDCTVDNEDLAILANEWHKEGVWQ